jgi:hypothetical protein
VIKRCLILGAILLCTATCFLAPGCSGWTTGSLVRDGLQKIYVPYFQNDTYYRGIEVDLTGQVLARIQERTDLHLVDRQSAEMILDGRIVDYEQRIVSEDVDNRTQESSAIMTVNVKLIRASDGTLIDEAVLRDRAEFFPDFGESLESSQADSFKRLSYRILNVVEKGF